jgi:predicted O-linked N-acetylglucosamine transferase (SPINDLY family)
MSEQLWNRVMQQRASGQLPQAIASVRMHLKFKPRDGHALHLLATLQMEAGELEQAVVSAERALASMPDNLDFVSTLASALARLRRFDQAIPLWERLLAASPDHAPTLAALSAAYAEAGDAERGVELGRRAVAMAPDSLPFISNLAIALGAAGRTEEHESLLRASALHRPHDTYLRSSLLMQMNYRLQDLDEMLEAHRAYGRLVPAPAPPRIVDPDPDRPLRVGIISPDLCRSSVANFLPASLGQQPGITLVAFFTGLAHPEDPVAKGLRGMFQEWFDMPRPSAEEIDARIRAARIDVLVDLAGHVGDNLLSKLARKPAPVLVTAIGYPNTTGVPAIDWRVVDSITDPPGAERLCTERLLRLDPCFLCYAPREPAPEPQLPPDDAPITFGSFNNHLKMSPQTLALWSATLAAVPDSRLLLKSSLVARSTREQSRNDRLLGQLAQAGIPRDRVDLMPHAEGTLAHLACYHRLHVALDTTPYNGTTTTCEALWMGVPVITTLGDRHAARVSASLVTAIGHPEWVASDAADFARIAAGVAADRTRIAAWRRTLRESMRTSALCDASAYAHRFMGSLRDCWREACRTAAH